jgi:multiple sugar transport system permease protein
MKKNLWATMTASTFALFFTLPLIGAIYTSFRTDNAIVSGPFVWEFDYGFTHYKNAMGAAGYDFASFFQNSILISTGTVILTTFISFPAAYAIVRLGFGGAWLLRIALSLRILPAVFFIIPFYKLFTNLTLVDTIRGLILANTFVNITLALLIFSSAIKDLPYEIEEAAHVDGAGIFRILLSIVFPLMGPGLAAVGVLTFIFSWSDYLFAVVLSSSEATPVTVGAANFVTSYGVRWGDISAAVTLSVLPPLIFATLAQKYLVKGLSSGAIKG